jgi:hypothetical protein
VARQRMRPVRRRPGESPEETASGGGVPSPSPPARRRVGAAAWRQTLDSYGGFWTLGIIAVAVIFVGTLVFANAGASNASDDPLMGEEIPALGKADHVAGDAQLLIPEGRPPVNGPHFGTPQAPGLYDGPVPDGNAIHSLEHGIIWITYNPAKVDQGAINALRDLQGDHSRDVILSPRPANTASIAAASWGRLLQQDSLNKGELERFIETNRNRSPEPGVR